MTHVFSVKSVREAIDGLPDEARVMIQVNEDDDMFDCGLEAAELSSANITREHDDVVIRVALIVYEPEDND